MDEVGHGGVEVAEHGLHGLLADVLECAAREALGAPCELVVGDVVGEFVARWLDVDAEDLLACLEVGQGDEDVLVEAFEDSGRDVLGLVGRGDDDDAGLLPLVGQAVELCEEGGQYSALGAAVAGRLVAAAQGIDLVDEDERGARVGLAPRAGEEGGDELGRFAEPLAHEVRALDAEERGAEH